MDYQTKERVEKSYLLQDTASDVSGRGLVTPYCAHLADYCDKESLAELVAGLQHQVFKTTAALEKYIKATESDGDNVRIAYDMAEKLVETMNAAATALCVLSVNAGRYKGWPVDIMNLIAKKHDLQGDV
jgi:hypothetical protein